MPKKILIVEDDAAIGEVLYLMLEGAGYEVHVESDGRSVLPMQKPFPDVLLLDIRLSGISGQQLCRQIKQQETTHSIPIILLSAHKDIQRIAREAGADDFLVKPFEMEAVLILVARYVGRT